MSYCRFSEGDVYMFASTCGGIECCACGLAKKVPTIFSPGVIDVDDPRYKTLIDNGKLVCDKCESGCDACMMHGNVTLKTYQEAIDHLKAHRENGDVVPEYAFEALRRDMKDGRPLEPLLCECGEVACVFDFKNNKQTCIKCALENDEKTK